MKTIRSRLLTSMLLTGLVPLVVVLVPLGTVLHRNLMDQEREKLSETVTQLGRLVAEVTGRTARELKSLQSNPLLADPSGDVETKLAEMRRLVKILEVYSDISLYGSDGFLITSTAEEHPSYREYSDWFREAMQGKMVLSHPQRVLGKEGLYLTVYLPVESDSESSRQVIKARLSFERIVSILSETSVGAGHSVYLLDNLGNVLSGGQSSQHLSKFDPAIPAKLWFDVAGGTYSLPSGESCLYARAVLSSDVTLVDAPWVVIATKPMSQVTAVIRQAVIALTGAAALMMALAGVVGMLLAQLISRPLENIGDMAEKVGGGDLAARAEEDKGSIEARTLAKLFNRMVGELAEHRDGLERLVASRTESLHISQSELERANARLSAAIESTNNGFLVEDLDGKVAVVNDLFLSLLGHSDALVDGAPAATVIGTFLDKGEFTIDRRSKWCARLSTNGVIDSEVVLALPEVRVLHVYSAPIRNLRGNVIGRVWSTQDLTEQRQLEEGLRQSQKMEAVGQLAGGIAHDFNNLLAGILGNLALVKMELGDTGGKEANESLAHAIKAGERAAELVRQLLGFSRRSRMDLKPCDVGLVLSEVRDILSATIDPRIQIVVERSEDPWRVMADVGLLGQVIMNMAVNAKDAMPKGGRLHLRSSNRRLEASDLRSHPEIHPGEFVCLTVEDEGEGIPLEVQQKIFEPFFTTKEPGKGTGLGLATSFGIVKQLGGWIDFRSAPGEGTCFDIYLPRSSAAENADAPVLLAIPTNGAGKMAAANDETILLVDDEALVRRIGRT
ncbi:MAG TPA: ATP-binding protein, partial [Bacteroidia bacterium]|nr:ATP-binding protein [Bacteroidia bacterium]